MKRRFVSSLLVLENDKKLLSAGGEDDLYIWDLQSMKLQTKRNIAALRDHLIIPSPRRSGDGDARSRNPRRKGNKKGKGGKKGDAADEKEAEEAEAEQAAEAGDQPEEGEKALVISNIFPLHHESWVGVTSSGYVPQDRCFLLIELTDRLVLQRVCYSGFEPPQ